MALPAPERRWLTRNMPKNESDPLITSLRELLRTRDAVVRLIAMVIGGAIAGIVAGFFGAFAYSLLIGWDVAALIFTSWVWISVGTMDQAATGKHATRENPSRGITDALVLIGSLASLVAVGFVLVQSASEDKATQAMLAALTLLSVALSWVLVHTLFTLRYAKVYYDRKPGDVDFNNAEEPTYLDFAYLAFTIGMTFQVSDTNLRTRAFRSIALRHALLSYLFGTVILGATINLIAGLSSS